MWTSTTTNIRGTNVQEESAGGGGHVNDVFLLP